VNKHAKDSDESVTTILGCRHLSVIKDLTKEFANNLNLSPSKEKKGQKCKIGHEEKILRNGVLFIVLGDKKTNDAIASSEEDELIRCHCDKKGHPKVQRDINNILNLFVFKFVKH